MGLLFQVNPDFLMRINVIVLVGLKGEVSNHTLYIFKDTTFSLIPYND